MTGRTGASLVYEPTTEERSQLTEQAAERRASVLEAMADDARLALSTFTAEEAALFAAGILPALRPAYDAMIKANTGQAFEASADDAFYLALAMLNDALGKGKGGV